jgi:GNAT superfamily N-acetyltransferase
VRQVSNEITVVPMRPDQWRELRALRLEMLEDSPLAYVESLESARQVRDEAWQERARRYTAPGSLNLVAVEPGGTWVGTMSAYVAAGRAWLVAVYVAPSHRGRQHGTADALLDGVEEWVRLRGHLQLWLEVHEDNPQAHGFYLRRGYAFTGATRPYDLDPTTNEREMVRAL